MAAQFDLAIIGGGIIGLATAMKISASHPGVKLLTLEKESRIASHQTGHNSGVIHSGIYYRPGSVKARTCVAGRKALLEFCDRNGIPYDLCGKVVVATSEEELPRLEELHRRGAANGVQGLEMIEPAQLREIEPYANGLKALYVPTTGIIDFAKVTEAYAANVRQDHRRAGRRACAGNVIGRIPLPLSYQLWRTSLRSPCRYGEARARCRAASL